MDVDGSRAPAVGVDRHRAGRGRAARPGRAARRRRRGRLPGQGRGARARRGVRHAPAPARARAAAHGGGARARALARAAAAGVPADRAARRRRRSWATRRCCAGTRPGGVMSAPADFIPVAEESALIVEIGAWTLMQACHESAAAFGVGADAPVVDVNLSRRQLAQPDLPAAGRRLPALERAARAPPAARGQGDRAAGRARDRAAQPRRTCASIGVVLVLDDFGTGYSSLRDLPVAAVKIDRSFVGAARNAAPGTPRSSPRSSRWRTRWGSTRSPRASSTRPRRRGCASSAARSRRAICSAPPGPRITSGP